MVEEDMKILLNQVSAWGKSGESEGEKQIACFKLWLSMFLIASFYTNNLTENEGWKKST